MAHFLESDCHTQDGITRCIDRLNVCADVLAQGGACQNLSMRDEELLVLSMCCSPQYECLLHLRTGILEVCDEMAARMRVIRAEGIAETLSKPRALLADGDAVWLVTAGSPEHTQSLLDALDARPDAGFQAVQDAASACGEAVFAVARVALPGAYQTILVPSEIAQGERVADYVSEQIEAAECPPKLAIAFMTSLDELFSNIVFYSGSPDVEVGCSIAGGYVSVRLADSGKPFDPNDVQQPDTSLSADERKIGGLGVFMVKKLMDSFEYEYRAGQNISIIRKRIPG